MYIVQSVEDDQSYKNKFLYNIIVLIRRLLNYCNNHEEKNIIIYNMSTFDKNGMWFFSGRYYNKRLEKTLTSWYSTNYL